MMNPELKAGNRHCSWGDSASASRMGDKAGTRRETRASDEMASLARAMTGRMRNGMSG